MKERVTINYKPEAARWALEIREPDVHTVWTIPADDMSHQSLVKAFRVLLRLHRTDPEDNDGYTRMRVDAPQD